MAQAVEQEQQGTLTEINEKHEASTVASFKAADASNETTTTSIRERYPYGYSGELSGECEIPLAVLKKVYEGYDSEDDDNDGELRHVAMVVEEPIEETKEEGFGSDDMSATGVGPEVPREAHELNKGD
jgi:hypothetical protein